MIWLYIAIYESSEDRRRKHLPGFFSYYHVGDVATSHITTNIEH